MVSIWPRSSCAYTINRQTNLSLNCCGVCDQHHYAIYQVEETNSVDTLKVLHVFSKAQYTIIDYQMAKTAFQGLILAGHLIDFEGFSIQTGGTLSMRSEILESDVVATLNRSFSVTIGKANSIRLTISAITFLISCGFMSISNAKRSQCRSIIHLSLFSPPILKANFWLKLG